MDERELEQRLRERTGTRASEARRALGAALGALRCALADDDAESLAHALPAAVRGVLLRPRSSVVEDLAGLYAEAERRERVGHGFAVEHVQSVLGVLADVLDGDLVRRLRGRLPPEIAELLREREPPAEPPAHVHTHPAKAPTERPTLSRARPGTAEPIAETRHDVAHTRSVARSRSANADRMVETARSTRPGREDETLATARQGTPKPK
jgi:uncharacterized protein (DUF2267 family)